VQRRRDLGERHTAPVHALAHEAPLALADPDRPLQGGALVVDVPDPQ
jgi:hypothetical protein